MIKLIPIVVLILVTLAAAPSPAQTGAPTSSAPSRGGGNNSGTGNSSSGSSGSSSSGEVTIYRRVTVEIGNLLPGSIDLGEPEENQAQTPDEPAVRDTPVFVDLPVPLVRPAIYRGRPILVDAPHDPGKLVVIFSPEVTNPEALMRAVRSRTAFALELITQRQRAPDNLVVALYRIPAGSDLSVILGVLRSVPGVVGAQPQYLYRGQAGAAAPADMTSLQYAPRKLRALRARAAGDGKGVTIGLIDTGVDLDQPGFGDADISVFDVLPGRAVNDLGHGTSLAGLMLASRGFDGIAPGARLVAIRAFDTGPDGAAISGSYEIAAAIDLAVNEGVKVLNLSFAGPRDPLVLSVLDDAAASGLIFAAAAGNGGPEAAPAYPGAHRDAIAVTATDIKDRVFSGANRGFYIAVAAPGVDVLSPVPGASFEMLTGTSIATAHVTAIVALMLERNPGLSRQQVIDVLKGSARDLGEPGPDNLFGAGLADAEAAVEAAAHE